MANNQLANDIYRILNGVAKVAKAHGAIQKASSTSVLNNSTVIKALANFPDSVESVPRSQDDIRNLVERASMVGHGLQQFTQVASKHVLGRPYGVKQKESSQEASSTHTSATSANTDPDDVLFIREEDLESLYVKSLGVEVLQQNEDGKKYAKEQKIVIFDSEAPGESVDLNADDFLKITPLLPNKTYSQVSDNSSQTAKTGKTMPSDKILQPQKGSDPVQTAQELMEELKQQLGASVTSTKAEPSGDRQHVRLGVKPLSQKKPTSHLAPTSRERKVPASRIGRLVSFGGLAAGLGFGAVTEMTKRSLGLKENSEAQSAFGSSPFLSEANAERIVDTMCRVRGAALKIGQIMSIQDNSIIHPQLQKIFERVRNAADFMPKWQMEQMLATELGHDWRSKLEEFEEKPFAAASIGQVHLGRLHDQRPVAIKIQYPGVAQGIESDIDNLVSVLNVWDILPKGMFIESLIVVAKRELRWECDYEREAECAKKFRQVLQPYPDYYVPEVIDELTTKQVYTTELIDGVPVDQCSDLDQETRDRISELLLDLFFRELFEFRFMQTDPNWSNFLYNVDTKQVGLLDFGASRDFSQEFADKYMMILRGAAENDREMVVDYSRQIGFLTGYESKTMENAHVETVMLLGEAFRVGDAAYDFGNQNLTSRIQELVPVMMSERLCPPPEEVYSLHRKLSGMFLLCAKLRGRIKCRPIFDRVWNEYMKRNK